MRGAVFFIAHPGLLFWMFDKVVFKSGIILTNYPVECADDSAADSEKNALKVCMCMCVFEK